ncbi:MAG: 4-hydroxy-tetrahydrodipicolinate reductase [Candidatus Omnitrophica bacterium]|nr:4-hydroxy-tetrahydrodipicolinate reductase [Candidatus Omnitrophota bacterium]
MVKIVVSGAQGRMGKRITSLAEKDSDLEVVAGVELKANPEENIVSDLNLIKNDYNCIVEFTTPAATIEHVKMAAKLKKAMVVGTTGLSDKDVKVIREASKTIPIVFSPNMSVGVNVLFGLIEKAAGILGKEYTASIKEAHHIHKKDKPSGTAKFMAKIAKEKLGDVDIPTESIRKGEIVGDHDITFESEVDTLKISHSAKTRDIFALGALKAAKFVVKKKKGLFSMRDILSSKG